MSSDLDGVYVKSLRQRILCFNSFRVREKWQYIYLYFLYHLNTISTLNIILVYYRDWGQNVGSLGFLDSIKSPTRTHSFYNTPLCSSALMTESWLSILVLNKVSFNQHLPPSCAYSSRDKGGYNFSRWQGDTCCVSSRNWSKKSATLAPKYLQSPVPAHEARSANGATKPTQTKQRILVYADGVCYDVTHRKCTMQ
jgi:hypothetical protein